MKQNELKNKQNKLNQFFLKLMCMFYDSNSF